MVAKALTFCGSSICFNVSLWDCHVLSSIRCKSLVGVSSTWGLIFIKKKKNRFRFVLFYAQILDLECNHLYFDNKTSTVND